MLKRIVYKSINKRKNKIIAAILAIVMGASMVSALVNISLDLNNKVAKELRAFGSNLVLFPDEKREIEGNFLTMDEINKLAATDFIEDIYGYVPYLYNIGKLKENNVVIVGTQFANIRKTSPWWKVEGNWIDDNSEEGSIMLGVKVAKKLGYKIGDEVLLSTRKETTKKVEGNQGNMNNKQIDEVASVSPGINGDATKRWPLNILSEIDYGEYLPKKFKVVGIVTTGSSEDNQVFIKLQEAQQLFAMKSQVNLVQVSVLTNENSIAQVAQKMEKLIPGTKTKVLSQISKAEGNIQGKIQFLMVLVTILTLIASGLSVLSTMTTTVLERRKEVGIMKAIGAQNKKIASIFYTEAGAIGLLGGVFGYILGFLMAQVVGKSVFDTFISFHFSVIPITLVSAMLLSLVASKIPVGKAIKIDPAVTLRGE